MSRRNTRSRFCCCCCITWECGLAFTAQYGEEKVLKSNFKIGYIEKSYLMGLVVVEIVSQFLHPYFLGDRFAFMPLTLISTYHAVGNIYSWIWQLRRILT
ncbi:hypothetical protein YC2023_047802 [Brassica napus]